MAVTKAQIWRYGLRGLLAVSLLLNAIALGVLLRFGSVIEELGFRDTSFPREVREAFRDEFKSPAGDPVRAALKDVAEGRRALIALGTQEPFDEAAVQAAMAKARANSTVLIEAGQAVLLEAMRKAAEK